MNAIITGATKGIGRSIAEKFAGENYNICLCARNEDELKETADVLWHINPKIEVHYQACDVSQQQELEAFADFCLSSFSQIDLLINNAGFFVPGTIAEEEEGMLDKMMQTNVYSAYHLSRKIIPQLRKQKSGLIVNISSVAGLQAYPQGGSYSISKFALTGFSKNLRNELKDDGIKVSTIYPGATYSDSWKESKVDEHRIMEANDIAEVVLSLTKLSPKAVAEDIVLRPMLGDL